MRGLIGVATDWREQQFQDLVLVLRMKVNDINGWTHVALDYCIMTF